MIRRPIPHWLVAATWLSITLWCVAGSVALVIGVAWLIALAAQWIGTIGMWVVGS